MLKLISALFSKKPNAANAKETTPSQLQNSTPPAVLKAAGVPDFPLQEALVFVSGTPVPNWNQLHQWLDTIPDDTARSLAWADAEIAWLSHVQQALGPQYHISVMGDAVVLSSLEPKIANTVLVFMTKTLQRVVRLLADLAQIPSGGRDILIVLDTEQQYYEYVSRYYAEDGEYSLSSGMYIHGGCGHFVCVKSDLAVIEPIIAHEMTHSCLSHLPIPAWLNEGLAVNTETKLCSAAGSEFTPAEMRVKHQQFWNESTIQEFWSGKSFLRTDDGNRLSYDLGRILVLHLSPNWAQFAQFARAANLADGGLKAAHTHLHIDLGAMVTALFEIEENAKFSPDPSCWGADPERGAF
jgi:hypothetical protein